MALRPRTVNFDETWQKISSTVDAVICLKKVTKNDWNERFSDVYSMCVAHPEPLVDRLYFEVRTLLTSHVEKIYMEISSASYYLELYYNHWSQYNNGCRFLNILFRHLNQHIKAEKHDGGDVSPFSMPTPEFEKTLEVGELALKIWKEVIIEPLKEQLVAELLVEIKKDREGENTQHNMIIGAIESFVIVQEYYPRGKLQLYETEFERKLLDETREFYRRVSSRLVSELTCSAYLVKADNLIQDEKIRASRLFHNSSTNKVNKECEGQLVESHVTLLQTECRQMIKDENLEDLGRMYLLMKSSVMGLRSMVQLLEDNIKEKGLETVRCIDAEKAPHNYVDALLQIHRKYFDLINNTFNGDAAFLRALDQACYVIVNSSQSEKKNCQSAELACLNGATCWSDIIQQLCNMLASFEHYAECWSMFDDLARFADSILKKSQRNLSESEQEEKMNDIIIIFKYLDNKDIFQKFYAKMLAKRLIHNLSMSMDAEENLINRLKHTCGYEYTNNLHRMFTDINLSKGLNKDFTDGLADTDRKLKISASFLILQSGAWPLAQNAISPLTIPQEFADAITLFEEFYNKRFIGRKLTWLHHLSNGEVRLNFLKKTYIVTASSYQMAVLLLYNHSESLSYSEIATQTDISPKELERTLKSLLAVKLLISSEPSEFTQSTLSVNKEFSNKRTKLKITVPVMRETVQEVNQFRSSIDEDRKLYIQATVVRVMKARKILKHNILIQEVISQSKTRFSPSVPMIKKAIESLIEKQYLERSGGSKDEYTYLA